MRLRGSPGCATLPESRVQRVVVEFLIHKVLSLRVLSPLQ